MTINDLQTILDYLESREDDFAQHCSQRFARTAGQRDHGEARAQDVIYQLSEFIRNTDLANEFLQEDEEL